MKNCFNRISRRAAYRETGISVDSVRQRVARKLGDAPEEQERTRRRMKKRLVLSVVVAILLFATAAAATSFHLGILIPGNLGIVQSNIRTEPVSGQLGEFEVTVLESVCDESSVYMTVSVKGLTSKAVQLVKDGSVHDLLDVYVDGALGQTRYGIIFNDEVPELCTEDTVCMVGGFNHPNPDRKPLIVRIDPYFLEDYYPGVTVTETLTVPTDNQAGGGFTITPEQNLTVNKGVLSNQPIAVNSLKDSETQITVNRVILSQFGVRIDYTDHSRECQLDGGFFLQMADGSIRTYNEIFMGNGGGGGGKNDDYTVYGQFRELTDLKAFKAFVIGTTAYPLDGGRPYTVSIDPKLKPFFLPIRKIMVPDPRLGERPRVFWQARGLCDQLGAAYAWDEAKRTATITYRGKAVTLPLGEHGVDWPGRQQTVMVDTRLIDGTLYVSSDLGVPLCLTTISTGANHEKTIILVP